jgi:CRP/FNR family transcriptional regulator
LAEEKKTLLRNTTIVVYSKGEKIIKQNEFISHIIFIIKGYVKIHLELNGKEIIINIRGPETLAGISSMLTFEKHCFSITALDDTLVCYISVDIIRNFIEKNGKFARNLIDYLNITSQEYVDYNLLTLTQNNIYGRLANALLYLTEKVFKKPTFDIMFSRKELAQFCKISRENVIKILYQFDAEGLIKLNGKQIKILEPHQLKKLVVFG